MKNHSDFKVGKEYVEGPFNPPARQRRWVCVGHRTAGDALIESCQGHVVTTVITPAHWSEVPSIKGLVNELIDIYENDNLNYDVKKQMMVDAIQGFIR